MNEKQKEHVKFQMLDPSVLTDLEKLTLCSGCNQKFNDAEQSPKFLNCKHCLCLRCVENILSKSHELLCTQCYRTTELGDKGLDALPTYSPLVALAKHFSNIKINMNSTSVKPIDKERKVHFKCTFHNFIFYFAKF